MRESGSAENDVIALNKMLVNDFCSMDEPSGSEVVNLPGS